MSVRQYLNEKLTPLLPYTWVIYDYAKTLSNISKVTAMYDHKTIVPGPQNGSLLHTVELIVMTPSNVESNFETSLDEVMEDLIPAMRAIPGIEFISASKGSLYNFPMWSVQLQILTTS